MQSSGERKGASSTYTAVTKCTAESLPVVDRGRERCCLAGEISCKLQKSHRLQGFVLLLGRNWQA